MRTRIILLAVIATIVATGFYFGLFQHLTPDRLGALAEAAGPWGPFIIVALFALLEPFGVPGAIFMLTATALWPFGLAFAVNWMGGTAAGMFGFGFARYFARDWVEDRMPERLRRWDVRLSNEGLPVVILFRTLFFLNPASHWALGLSRVPASKATIGTAIAFAPWTAVWTYFGERILAWFDDPSLEWLLIGGAVLAAVLIGRALLRRYRRQSVVVESGPPA